MSVSELPFFDSGRRSVVPRLVSFLEQTAARLRAWSRHMEGISTLRGMSDRELKDIGVNRCDVERIASMARSEAIDTALRGRPGSTVL